MADGAQDVLDTIPAFSEGGGAAPAAGGQPGAEPTPPASGAEGGEQPNSGEAAAPKTALEAAERVMAGRDGASPAPPKQPQDGKPQDAKPATDPKAQADAALPFKDHPRWKEVTSENRILRVAKEKNEEAIKVLEPKATTYDELTTYLREANLGKDDFAAMLSIGVAIRNDPIAAYDMLKPIMERLEAAAGIALPPDLQQLVQNGQMTEEAARITARARAEAQVATGRMQDMTRKNAETEAQRNQREAEQHAENVVKDIVAYTDTWAARDPDAARKRPFVEREIELELRRLDGLGKAPRSPEEIRKIVDEATRSVEEQIRGFAPAPRASSGPLPSGGTPPNAAPIPKTSLEAAQMALRPTG